MNAEASRELRVSQIIRQDETIQGDGYQGTLRTPEQANDRRCLLFGGWGWIGNMRVEVGFERVRCG